MYGNNLIEWISHYTPLTQAFFATLFTWGVTALGASLVFFFQKINQKVLGDKTGFVV